MCIFFLWRITELWLCGCTQPRNANKTQICTLNKSVDNSRSTCTGSSTGELLSPGDKPGGRWGGQTNLMRNTAGAISLFSDAFLPADGRCDTARAHSLSGSMSHSAACWTPFSAQINCAGLTRRSAKVSLRWEKKNASTLIQHKYKWGTPFFFFFTPPNPNLYSPAASGWPHLFA